jgi:hypothetical protein
VREQRNRQIVVAFCHLRRRRWLWSCAAWWKTSRSSRRWPWIGEGDFAVRARTTSGDELAGLGSAFNDMTERLSAAQQDLEARNRELASTLEELQASRQRLEVLEQLKGELSKFVPDAVKELLERDPSATRHGARQEEVSVLFLTSGYASASKSRQAAEPAGADVFLRLPRDHP